MSIVRKGLSFLKRCVPTPKIKVSVSYLSPDHRLEGKKIVVTGGSRGMGFSMAKKFMKEGARVLIAGRDEAALEESAGLLGCPSLRLDVRRIDAFDTFLSDAWALLDGIDCLVNNAGISHHEPSFLEVGVADFDTQFDTNVKGAYFLTQKFVERLVGDKRTGGKILFISSERGMMADDLPYGLCKAAINSFVQGLATDLAEYGIRVNALAPGVTATDMTGYHADGNLFNSTQATSRVYLPEEMAETACFLLSDAANLINGQIIVCNEGKSINYKR